MNFSDYPNAGYWIQTVAYFLSGLGGLGVLVQVHLLRKQLKAAEDARINSESASDRQLQALNDQMRSAEKQSRCRATVDIVLHEKTDKEYLSARKEFAALKAANKTLTKFACADAGTDVEANQAILLVLNQYEFMSAGIFAGAFDEEIYMRMKRSLLIRDWDSLSTYVSELRRLKSNPALFIEFEKLAVKWRAAVAPH